MDRTRFDELARSLATPMPRRRAVRLLGGAVVAAAVPGFWARPSRAGFTRGTGACPPGGQQTCAEQFGKDISECCDRPIPGSGNYTCCAPGECWYSPTTNTCCPKAAQCGASGTSTAACCQEGYKCVDGKCKQCVKCGDTLCCGDEVCANPTRKLCCQKNWRQCRASDAGVVKCCPPTEKCCLKAGRATAKCCGPAQTCTDGECRCPKGTKKCGEKDCCKKGEVCSNGKCCPKGKVNCGDGDCCAKSKCCGDTCCGEKEICSSSIAYSKPKVCCPSNRIIKLPSGKPVCCPKNTVPDDADTGCCPPGDPKCCGGGGDDPLVCLGNMMCVRGTCQRVG